MELVLNHITKEFGRKTAVKQMSMKLTPGVYGLLGANGAGKTTLMRMICGVLKPTSGKILLDGKDTNILGENYYSLLGYLPQDFGYYPQFTAWDFLLYMGALKGLPEKRARRKAKELLQMTSLTEVRNKKIKSFSGGMKRRLGVAQAMMNDPKIVIFDEPTAGLDPKERVRFRNLISEFAKENIVIISTHITSDVESIANKIYVIKDGEILSVGTVEMLNQSMRGKVWSCKVPRSEIRKLEKRFCIVNLKHGGDLAELRIISDKKPTESAIMQNSTLEDFYLYHFQNDIDQEEE